MFEIVRFFCVAKKAINLMHTFAKDSGSESNQVSIADVLRHNDARRNAS
jgi:hypothetical protein